VIPNHLMDAPSSCFLSFPSFPTHQHVDGAGKVAGSVVVSLPVDRWSAPEEENSFIGHGGGLTFWDGKDPQTKRLQEIHYDTRCGDLAFIDRYDTL
jgi:hypothetical protein